MKFYQRILISAHSKVDKAGWFNSRRGFFVYSVVYFSYKRHLEARQLIRQLAYLSRSNSGFSSASLIIDVGAHIGFFTKESLKFFPLTKVIAIEPPGKNSVSFQVLHSERIAEGLIEFQNAAAWSFNGVIPFHFESSNTANNHFDSNSTTKVPCITLDSVTNPKTPSVLILKIDVQGFEFEVLEGAVETLKRHKVALLIELDETALQARGRSSVELVNKLRGLGYYPKDFRNGGGFNLQEVTSMLDKKDCLDFLFVPVAN
jgi:FkbM family methyltransferase